MFEEKKLYNKRILMIVASKNFRDEEYFIPFEIFQKEGAKVVTASSIKGSIVGIEGGEARSVLTLKSVEVKNFDAIVFVGGNGASEYFDNNEAHRIVQEAANYKKILGAICIAPVILSRAGVLVGRKATVWSSISNRRELEELKSAGCLVLDRRVVRDGRIVTADGPAVADEFAKMVVKAIIAEDAKNQKNKR